MKNKKIIRMPHLTGARQASYKKGLMHFHERMVKSANIILRNLVRGLTPWIAMVLTGFRYTDGKSRFLDKLQILAEE